MFRGALRLAKFNPIRRHMTTARFDIGTLKRFNSLNSARLLFKQNISLQPLRRDYNSHSETKPIVGYFFLFSASLVFVIVIVGGLTRLTESGLSITEWNVIKGMKPPRNDMEWNEEFDKYKQFPEYKLLYTN